MIPLYPARCINCGLTRGSAVRQNTTSWFRGLDATQKLWIVGAVAFVYLLCVLFIRSREHRSRGGTDNAPLVANSTFTGDFNEGAAFTALFGNYNSVERSSSVAVSGRYDPLGHAGKVALILAGIHRVGFKNWPGVHTPEEVQREFTQCTQLYLMKVRLAEPRPHLAQNTPSSRSHCSYSVF